LPRITWPKRSSRVSAFQIDVKDEGLRTKAQDQLWTQSFGFPVPSSVPLMYQFLPSGS